MLKVCPPFSTVVVLAQNGGVLWKHESVPESFMRPPSSSSLRWHIHLSAGTQRCSAWVWLKNVFIQSRRCALVHAGPLKQGSAFSSGPEAEMLHASVHSVLLLCSFELQHEDWSTRWAAPVPAGAVKTTDLHKSVNFHQRASSQRVLLIWIWDSVAHFLTFRLKPKDQCVFHPSWLTFTHHASQKHHSKCF